MKRMDHKSNRFILKFSIVFKQTRKKPSKFHEFVLHLGEFRLNVELTWHIKTKNTFKVDVTRVSIRNYRLVFVQYSEFRFYFLPLCSMIIGYHLSTYVTTYVHSLKVDRKKRKKSSKLITFKNTQKTDDSRAYTRYHYF